VPDNSVTGYMSYKVQSVPHVTCKPLVGPCRSITELYTGNVNVASVCQFISVSVLK
jgi:hypothetical protein